eukprot:CAMPEP_0119128306 /NCGR_PEP_ID=MMETSP1310-20130426/6518_1 /TAXON_ID=464262 /ORGANISM="Genus nov. species nov., Strain RCC2339" /LENGTH=443 /DNA_ID=CAMNT_0007118637 /DNA_START=241 /DNA_END=1575 /DNA_ORIENTATION=-
MERKKEVCTERGGTLWTVRSVFLLGLAIRLVLVCYGYIQDSLSAVKYTDIDYHVFSDGARFLLNGGSPYERATFRYTPLLAYLLLPSVAIHPVCGKLMFVAADILVGIFLYRILLLVHPIGPDAQRAKNLALWLLNPIAINTCTRGNAEAIISLAVVASLYYTVRGSWLWGGLLFGLAVHLKVYPVIYGPAFVLYIVAMNTTTRPLQSSIFAIARQARSFAGPVGVFVGASLVACVGLCVLFYSIFGHDFLEHTYLYHFTRIDHRHNFSVYFYTLYLSGKSRSTGLVAFLPQVALLLSCTLSFVSVRLTIPRYHRKDVIMARHLVFCLFCLTFMFVIFNKVCTVQYFVWYLVFLPIIAPSLATSWREAVALGSVWLASMVLWLGVAYLLEFQNMDVYLYLWMASAWFLLANALILCHLITKWEPHLTPTSTHPANLTKRKEPS